MKRFLSIIICLLLLSAAFKDLMIYGLYYSNKAYITETFCVNKETINTQCNGYCHLTKTIANQETEGRELPKPPCPEEKASFIISWPDLPSFRNFHLTRTRVNCIPFLRGISEDVPLTPPPQTQLLFS